MTPPEIVSELMRRHFSAHAGEYDRYAVVQKGVAATLVDLLPGGISAEAGPVLDLGVGTGELAARFRERHPRIPLLVADIAHGMTCRARSRLPGVLACDADAAALPLRDESCGLVLSASMYQWVTDLPRAFAEAHRVLKPGGLFACALFGSETLGELRAAHLAALAEVGGGASYMQEFPAVAAVRAALDRAGFTAAVTTDYAREEHPDVPTLLRHLKRIGAQNAAAERPGGLGGRRTTLRMMEIYAERFGQGGTIPVTWQIIYLCGRKGG